VVAKLLNLSQADVAVFGEKDFQQLAVIRRMVRDLAFPVEIVGHPVVREADGLALSSRNVYLSAAERAQAPAIYAGLQAARRLAQDGEADPATILRHFGKYLTAAAPLARIDYASIVHPETLDTLCRLDGPSHMAVAVHLGRARLIDNLRLCD